MASILPYFIYIGLATALRSTTSTINTKLAKQSAECRTIQHRDKLNALVETQLVEPFFEQKLVTARKALDFNSFNSQMSAEKVKNSTKKTRLFSAKTNLLINHFVKNGIDG